MSVPVLSRLFVASGATEVILRPSAEDTQSSAVTTEAVQAADRQSLVSKRRTASPTLRASSFPEVTNPFCRLPLSTLFYRLEAVHLGDLMRFIVRSGMRINLSPEFSRVDEYAPNTSRSKVLSQAV